MIIKFSTIVIHFDEIVLKGLNQKHFIDILIGNLQDLLPELSKISSKGSKLIIDLDKNIVQKDYELLISRLKLIPGIANFAPALACQTDLSSIKKVANDIYNNIKPKSFKIETSRSYKKFALDSTQVNSLIGEYVFEKNEESKVDVHDPDLVIKIEIDKNKTYVLSQKENGVGGLPVGSSGQVIGLLSGGIDSPVAAFQMMKRGCKVNFIHFQNKTLNKDKVQNKINKLVAQLAKVQGPSKLYIIPFEELQKQVITNVPADYRMIIYRRIMYKIVDLIAEKENIKAVVSGDSLGQVASQTMENMQVIQEATSLLQLKPLVGMNKNEIIQIAKKIGTYEISIEPYGDCCSFFVAKHPQTKARLEDVKKFEKELNIELIKDKLDYIDIN